MEELNFVHDDMDNKKEIVDEKAHSTSSKSGAERKNNAGLLKAGIALMFASSVVSLGATTYNALTRDKKNDDVKEFQCNVPLQDFELTDGSYTTDFLYTRVDGDKAVRETVYRKKLSLPRTGQQLDASRNYWLRHGITDWAIVIETEDSANAKE